MLGKVGGLALLLLLIKIQPEAMLTQKHCAETGKWI